MVHGPGTTGLTLGLENDPKHGEAHLKSRLDALRRNMIHTIEAMASSASASATGPGTARMETNR